MLDLGLPESLAIHTTVAKSSTSNKWLSTWLPTFLGVTLAMILIPFFLLFVNRIIILAWRHHKRSRDGSQIQDFRSWYSRIGLKNRLNHTRQRESRWRVVLNKLGIKHIATDYTAWFWASEESRLVAVEEQSDEFPARHYCLGWPRRLGSLLRRKGLSPSNNADHELEAGMCKSSLANAKDSRFDQTGHEMKRTRQLSWRHNDSITAISGALTVPSDPENMSTVRRRHISNGRPQFSDTNNEEINTTTSEGLDVTLSGHENERLPEIFPYFPSSHRNRSFAATIGRLKSIATRRITSMPVTSALSKLPYEQQELKEEQSSPRRPSKPELHRSRGSCNIHVPTNSEDISALTFSCRGNSTGHVRRSKSMSLLDASKTCYSQALVDDIDSRLTWLLAPKENEHLKSIGSKYCGISGRSGSPVTAYADDSTSPGVLLDDISAYEAEGSLDGAISLRESTTSIRMDMLHLSQYRKLWDNLTVSHTSSLSKSMPLLQSSPMLEATRISNSLSRFATPTVKAPSATPTSTLRPIKRKSAVDRGIHISMQDEAEDEREEFNMPQSFVSSPDADLSASIHHTSSIKHSSTKQTNLHSVSLSSLPRVEAGNPELPSKPQNDLALVQGELSSVSFDLVQRDSLSTVKDPWLQNLHTKLDKLHYELSPGFRSPAPAHWKIIDENVPIWSQGPHKLSMASKTWKTQRPKPGRTRKSTSSLPDPARDATSHSPELNSWRIKLNRLRCRLGTPQLCSLNSKPNVAPILLDETDIDTAAWILRQPPDGIGPEPGAGQMTYLGGFGRARTLAEWQQGPAPTNRKRTSSAASLANPSPCKTLRRAAPMIKVRLKRDNGVWRPLGFTNQTSLDGTLASENSDISGSRRASVVGERREGKGRGRFVVDVDVDALDGDVEVVVDLCGVDGMGSLESEDSAGSGSSLWSRWSGDGGE